MLHLAWYIYCWCIPQPSDFVLLRNGFYSYRAQIDKHPPVEPGANYTVGLWVRGVADLYHQRGHTTSNTRDRGITHSLQTFRQSIRSHSWSAFLFFAKIEFRRKIFDVIAGVCVCVSVFFTHSSCEIEDFVETRLCKPCVILRSRVLLTRY